MARKLALLDDNVSRRARITSWLFEGGRHVEPFESVDELVSHECGPAMFLVHDDGIAPIALLNHLQGKGEWAPMILYSGAPVLERVVRGVSNGALDYLAWPFDPVALSESLRANEIKADRIEQLRAREAKARSRIDRLSKREREVLDGIVNGMTGRAIGESLAISPRTVEIHRTNMLQKMGAKTVAEAIRIAVQALRLEEAQQPMD